MRGPSPREVTERICSVAADTISGKAMLYAKGRNVTSVSVSFSESASDETINIFKNAFAKASKGTVLEGAYIDAYRKSGCMPMDDSIYFEGIECVEPEEKGFLAFFKNLNPFSP